MTTLQVGTAFTVGSVLLARVDIARIVTADTLLQVPESLPREQRESYERACDYYGNPTLPGSDDIFGDSTVAATASGGGGGDDVGGRGTDSNAMWMCGNAAGLPLANLTSLCSGSHPRGTPF